MEFSAYNLLSISLLSNNRKDLLSLMSRLVKFLKLLMPVPTSILSLKLLWSIGLSINTYKWDNPVLMQCMRVISPFVTTYLFYKI